jgi:hypothetical protein
MAFGNANSIPPRAVGFEYQAGVGALQGATLPSPLSAAKSNSTKYGPSASSTAASTAGTAQGVYNGPLAGTSFLGEPFAWWLGLILILFLFKFLSEHSKLKYNPAKIEIGGYNFLAVGVTAAVFIALMKVLFTKFQIPGATEFFNAL